MRGELVLCSSKLIFQIGVFLLKVIDHAISLLWIGTALP